MNRIVALVITLAAAAGSLAMGPPPRARAQAPSPVREIEIVVRGGYQPGRITVPEGEPVRLRFVRHEYASCTREVVFPWLGLRRELPPHQPVVVELPAMRAGEYEYHCGMSMIRGTIVVVAQ